MVRKSAFVCFFLVAMFLFAGFSRSRDAFEKKAFSKSSDYYYEVEEGESSYFVGIYSKENECEFLDKSEYRKFDRFFVCWDDKEDFLWIWSSDIGFYTVKKNDGWKKESVNLESAKKDSIPTKMLLEVPFLKRYYN